MCLGNRYHSALLSCLEISTRADVFNFRVELSSSATGNTIAYTFPRSFQHSDDSLSLPAYLRIYLWVGKVKVFSPRDACMCSLCVMDHRTVGLRKTSKEIECAMGGGRE